MTYAWYTLWSPFYDVIAGPYFRGFRQDSIAQLRLSPGQSLLIPGVGSGLDFPYLPRGVAITGCDLNAAMLARARRRATALDLPCRLGLADAERMPYADESFDAAYLPCIVCVATRGDAVLREALRVVKPGGRVVVIDKFLGEDQDPGVLRRGADRVTGALFSRINRRWSEVARGVGGFTFLEESPGPLRGFFRRFVLQKNP